ncbi:MAG: SMP-30/gluconolactonase/LRE family protein [Gammaproteobacteria bacterium]|nr:SMP-30/gluconolactonase/LRE family protein [Gammaproteobacteria bacterium]
MPPAPRKHQSEVVVDGLRFGEGPRWHEGRLWFSDMHEGVVLAMTPQGELETICKVAGEPSGLGWLPDGRLLVVSMQDRRLMRQEASGELAVHADLSALARFHCNDMVVAEDGTAWVGNFGFDLHAREPFRSTELIRVDPNGHATIAAGDLGFPNGTVITPDGRTLIIAESFAGQLSAFDIEADRSLSHRRVWAKLPEGRVPDGICLDADGGIWVASPAGNVCLRMLEGGTVTDAVELDRGAFACMLGDDDRRTLYLCTARDSDPTKSLSRSGRIERVRVPVAGVGRP